MEIDIANNGIIHVDKCSKKIVRKVFSTEGQESVLFDVAGIVVEFSMSWGPEHCYQNVLVDDEKVWERDGSIGEAGFPSFQEDYMICAVSDEEVLSILQGLSALLHSGKV